MEQDAVPVGEELLNNAVFRVNAVQGIHPAGIRPVGALLQRNIPVGNAADVVPLIIHPGQACFLRGRYKYVKNSGVLVDLVVRPGDPHRQVAFVQGMNLAVISMGRVAVQHKADRDRVGVIKEDTDLKFGGQGAPGRRYGVDALSGHVEA